MEKELQIDNRVYCIEKSSYYGTRQLKIVVITLRDNCIDCIEKNSYYITRQLKIYYFVMRNL